MEVNCKGRIIYLEKPLIIPEVLFYNKCWKYHEYIRIYEKSTALLKSNEFVNKKFLKCKYKI
jgi:hypothetical protein